MEKNSIALLMLMFLLIGINQIRAASIISYSLTTQNPQQFEKVELNIQVSATFSNAYNIPEIILDMVATSPSGKTIVQPCFMSLVIVPHPTGQQDLHLKRAEITPIFSA
jgi:hypothetical protein